MTAAMPFDDLKVLDFGWWGVGPITIKYLADNGATVVHVESVTRPDGLRGSQPKKEGYPGLNASAFAANFNTSKLGLGLNMGKPQARDLVRRIITDWQPDIIAESFTPKTMRNWELDYPNVKELKPDIIYFSTCQQGQTGPHALPARLREHGRGYRWVSLHHGLARPDPVRYSRRLLGLHQPT